MPEFTLGELAQRFSLEVHGNPDYVVRHMCSLEDGAADGLGYLGDRKHLVKLKTTTAGAVIVRPQDAGQLAGSGLLAGNPQLAYARIAGLFDPRRQFTPGRHPAAVVDDSAEIGEGCWIGPGVVIGASCRIGAGTYIGPATLVGECARIGVGGRIEGQVWIERDVRIGDHCLIQPGAVIGGRGFGNAMGPNGWEEIPQLGSVVIGHHVEIGSNTTIDRGAIGDTIIEDNVRLDNLIQIAHNCHIGAHTAIASCAGIAGSTRVGKRCLIGGAAGLAGHIEIADDVIILGRAMVTNSLTEKGVYGSGLPVAPAREWRRTVARVRRLGRLEDRLRALEKHLGLGHPQDPEADE